MALLMVGTLEVLGLLTAALFVIGVPLVVALIAYDLADRRRREAAFASRRVAATAQPRPRVASTVPPGRLTA